MINRRGLCLLALLVWLLIGCQKQPSDTFEPPNIIYILADDLGYGDISALNSESAIHTPHLDRLVEEGLSFADAHSASAVCTPTRYGILTGRYAWRSSLKSGVLWGYSPPLIDPGTLTVASFLKSHGYHTGVVGKWHLGLGWQPVDPADPIQQFDHSYLYDPSMGSNVDFSKRVSGGPTELGFDYVYIIPASLDMTPYVYLENDKAVELPTSFTEGKSEAIDGRGVFWRAGEVSPTFNFLGVLDRLTDKALSFIRDHKGSQKPFFLYFPLTAPHAPWMPTPEVAGTSQAGRYGDFVRQVDLSIGKILSTLDSLSITANTLMVFSSDNGAHWTPDDKAQYSHRSNYIYRGQKADIYEGGHRIPYLVRWPDRIPAGQQSHQLISTTDFFATMAGLINQRVPEGSAQDSYNMIEIFFHPDTGTPVRPEMIQHSLSGLFALRQGKWKFTPVLGSGGFSVPATIRPQAGDPGQALYNLQTDPEERNNLIGDHPEQAEKMLQALQAATGHEF